MAAMPRSHGIVVRTAPITAAMIAAAGQLRAVSKHGVGWDNIDGVALAARARKWGAWYVADNLRRSLRRLDRYDGWKPVFSVSDAGAWRYVARPLGAGQEVARTEPPADPEPAAKLLARSEPNRSRL